MLVACSLGDGTGACERVAGRSCAVRGTEASGGIAREVEALQPVDADDDAVGAFLVHTEGDGGVGCKRSGVDCGGSEDGGGDSGGGGDGAARKAGGAEGRRVVRSRAETSGGRGVMMATA